MVRDWLYPEKIARPFFEFASTQVDRRQDAINLINLWNFRDPKLTHTVLSTAHLTDATLHDQPGRREQLSSMALRSIYAIAFSRFVNALVDRDVRKSTTATIAKDNVAVDSDEGPTSHRGQNSMYTHALKLGLPEAFVELRHQAIHEDMPSLEVLRMSTRQALDWLWERWWKVNVKGDAQPALSEWEEKHRRWKTSKDQFDSGEENGEADDSCCCQTGEKRKRENQEHDDEYDSNPESKGRSKDDSHNLSQPKLQYADQEHHVPSSKKKQRVNGLPHNSTSVDSTSTSDTRQFLQT